MMGSYRSFRDMRDDVCETARLRDPYELRDLLKFIGQPRELAEPLIEMMSVPERRSGFRRQKRRRYG